MTEEELFDAYRDVVSERDQLREAGDALWNDLKRGTPGLYGRTKDIDRWEALRGIGAEPPVEEFREC